MGVCNGVRTVNKLTTNFQDHSPITSLPFEKVGLPLSIAVDELSRFATLYWIDANEPKVIRSVPMRGANTVRTFIDG